MGEPLGLSMGPLSRCLKRNTLGVHTSVGENCSCVLQASLFPQAMLPREGCRVSLCPIPTSAFTSGQKMTSSVSAREWGLWGVWVVPEAGQPVPNMSCSLDSRAVTPITIARGASS